jgi:L-ascorbate metabolism protein UlaG (beta-lactamase superfamily)
MMLPVWASVLFLLLLAGMSWLGWGRRSTWEHWSGWPSLDPEDRTGCIQLGERLRAMEGAPLIEWLGHGTIRIEWGGEIILVDPVASGRITIAPRLFSTPRLVPDEPAGLVLITHAHMDHLDPRTLVRIPPTRLILPRGSARFLGWHLRRHHDVEEAESGLGISCGRLTVTAVQARHGGWRYPWQRGLIACGYIIENGPEAVYIAGDTAYGDHFRAIGGRYRPRWAVLPVGAYSPAWFLQCRHLNPREAATAGEDLGSEFIMPYHFGTYRVSLEKMQEPLMWFARESREKSYQWWLDAGKG